MTTERETSVSLKALSLSWILAALVLPAASGQGVAGSNFRPYDFPGEVVLRPEPVSYDLDSGSWQLDKTNTALLKEPDLGQRHVYRRVLRFGKDTNNAIALIWDQPKQRLYLDLNRNLDLTDDPAGVFVSTNKGSPQLFANIALPLKTATDFYPALLDLRLSADPAGNWLRVQPRPRCLWQAKVEAAGEPWQVAVADDLLNPEGPIAAKFLLPRPWAARTNHVFLRDTASGLVRFPDQLFWAGQAFHLERRFDTSGPSPVCKLAFTPQQPSLTELKLPGAFLDYAVLGDTNGYTVVLRQPPGVVMVPKGVYRVGTVWLKKGQAKAVRIDDRPRFVNATAPTSLVLGGPLTNSVVLSRSGRKLSMSYRLLGADGASYVLALQDRTRPPEFTVYHGARKVLSGKFQFG